MYLQSIELAGFKSFAQKTTLTFHRGVTAIVGPNGCGKSNVLDAIRWVLGEQSAKALRGGEMADVIFSGTDSRPAVGMAEVSMSFAECEKELGVDWNEVRITRRVFRDGNSEYFLNKTPCRLKDIHQLFMDTGIGRSAYSVMEQGKIDLILSSRPEDRRAIFEEAAGITKYKSQKREALRKLEATEANLLRLTDIVKEVKRQIGSLQRQAAKARRYQSIHSDLRTLETHFSQHEYGTLKAAQETAHQEIARLESIQVHQQEEIDREEGALAGQRQLLEETGRTFQVARQQVQDLQNHISNAENRIAVNHERAHEFHALVERYESDIAAAKEKLERQETEIHDTDLALEQITATLEFEQTRLNEKRSATNGLSAERVAAERKLQAQFNSITNVEHRVTSLRGEISRIHALREGSEARLAILTEELDQFAGTSDRIDAQVLATSDQIEQTRIALAATDEMARQADLAVDAVQGELATVVQQLHQVQRHLADKESKLEVLRQLNEEGEGFSEGTQAVLRGLDHPEFFKPSVRGAIAAQIDVDPRFIPAIEAALGIHLQAVVLADTMVAEAVLKTLSAKKLGRASLALPEFFPGEPETGEPGELPEGAIAWAVDCVKAAAEVEPLVRDLLRGIVVVTDVETAVRLKAAAPGFTFVTLGGEALSSAGILQGGQAGEVNSSVLHRKAQIAQLEAGALLDRADIERTTAQSENVSQRVDEARSAARETHEQSRHLNVTLSSLRGQLSLLERERQDNHGKAENLRRERETVETRLTEAAHKLETIEAESREATASLDELQTGQSVLQHQLAQLREQETELATELNDLRIRVATEQQRRDSLRDQRQPMTSRVAELHDLLGQRRSEIERFQARAAALVGESVRITAEIETARARAAEGERAANELAQQRAAVVAAIEADEAQLRILRRQMIESQDQRSQQQVKQTQIELRMENLREQMVRRYQTDLTDFVPDFYAFQCALRDQQKRRSRGAGAEANDEGTEASLAAPPPEESAGEQQIDWSQVEAMVRELDQRIDTMGPINIDAIQEFEELEERHRFLENQNNDLTKAKAELLDVIARINQTTKKLFAETFEQVRVNFQEMFIELFGGGKANLVLVNEADVLESGIEIIAKPPGKQLQSVSLLSGGEKTMTAVALLFAIYMVKPSPFCVLDEMDAPLDDSNINRFTKILDRFVAQSQFIVITHNKRTISKADVLYGVTMEEHGVSKLVGVKFSRRGDSADVASADERPLLTAVSDPAESFGKGDDGREDQLSAG